MVHVLLSCGTVLNFSANMGVTKNIKKNHPDCTEIARWSFTMPKIAVDYRNRVMQ